MSLALVTRGYEAPTTSDIVEAGSGIRIPFEMRDDDGALQDDVDFSGCVKISINGAAFDAPINVPEAVTGRTGKYTLELDETETVPGFVWLSVVKGGFRDVDITWTISNAATIDDLDAQSTALANNLTAAVNSLLSSIPSAVDATLTAVHGAGAWQGATAAAVVAALMAYGHDTGVTLAGLTKRLEALTTGQLVITNEGAYERHTWKDKDGVTLFTALVDKATGSRAASTLSGTL